MFVQGNVLAEKSLQVFVVEEVFVVEVSNIALNFETRLHLNVVLSGISSSSSNVMVMEFFRRTHVRRILKFIRDDHYH